MQTSTPAALAAIAALWLAAASPAAAQGNVPPEFDIDVNGWEGGAFPVPETNEFSHCAIERTYGDGMTLAFLMNDSGRLAVGIGRPDWSLDGTRELPAQLSVDGSEPLLVTARPASDKLLILPLGSDAQVRQALQRGNTVSITSELITHDFALTGTLNAINALSACAAKAVELAQSGATGGNRMTPETIAQLMDAAGVSGLALASPEEIDDAKLPIEQSWRIGPMRGALHQEPRGETMAMDEFLTGFVAQFEELCPGPFSSELQPTEEFSGLYALKTGTLTCEGEEATTHTELVVVLDDSFYTAFVHEGVEEDAETVGEINKRLTAMFRSMITGDQPAAQGEGGEAGEEGQDDGAGTE